MLFNTNDSGTLIGAMYQHANNKKDINQYNNVLDYIQLNSSDPTAKFLGMDLENSVNLTDNVKTKLQELKTELQKTGETGQAAVKGINSIMDETSNKTTKLGNAFKSVGKSIVNALTSAAIMAAVSWIIDKAKELWDELTGKAQKEKELEAISKATEKLDKSVSELQSSESELSSLNSQIKKIDDDIASIQAKGTLTLSDQGDIDRLARTKSLLESQQRILETNIKLQRESAAINAKDVLNTGYTGKTYSLEDNGKVVANEETNASYKDWAEYYQNDYTQQGYNQYVNAIREGNEKDQLKWKEVVDKNTVEITEYINTLYEVLASFQDSEGNIIAGYEDIYEEYVGYINNLQSMIDPNNFNQLLTDWSNDESLDYDFAGEFNKVVEDMYNMEEFDFNKLKSMNEEFFAKLEEQGIDDDTLNAILNYKRAIYDSTLKGINDKYNPENIPEIGGTYYDSEGNIHKIQAEESEVDRERQKLSDWGKEAGKDYLQFENDIDSGVLHKFGNVDMDKRTIIEWSDELKKTYEKELASWDNYNPEVGTIDTVFGGSSTFEWDETEHTIAFTPILQTEDGAVFLGKNEVYNYIDSVIAKAAEDGEISIDEILKIDSADGKKYGEEYGKGLIAGVDEVTGNEGIGAVDAGYLMHFSGKFGAWNLAKDYDSMGKDFQQSTQDAQSSYETLTNYVKSHPLEPGIENLDEQYEHLKEIMGDNWSDKYLEELTPEERQIALGIELEPDTESLDYDALKEELSKRMSPITVDVEIETKSSKGVADLKAMDDAFGDDLATAYNKTKVEGGKATATEIEAVNSAFGGTTFDAGADQDVNLLSSAIEQYNDALVENAGDADAAQTATNQLATAYVDQSGVLDTLIDDLDHVTDAEKEYYIQQLKEQGITNAQEVVESRLTKRYKAHATALKELSKYVTQNKTAFDKAVAAKDSDSEIITKMTDKVQNLIAVYNEEGKAIPELSPEIDADFIIKNAELIEDAIEGDIEAIGKLRVEASKKILFNAELYDDAFWSDANLLAQQIAELDSSDFEVGAYLNSAPFLATLASLQSQFSGTMAQFKAWISEITGGAITADYEWDTVRVGETTQGFNGAPSDARVNISAVDVKTLKGIKYKWNGTQTGATGKYGGGGSSKSSGGGGDNGGGGDSTNNDKASEDTDETFDWIEVAIQRIEEEIDRLDKVINDVYENWAKRNEKIGEKIKQLNQEIKAQTTAQEEYLRNAKKVAVNDGKELNWEDYGDDETTAKSSKQYAYDLEQYNKAVAAWATGDYQRKVREGLMSGNDIEKIANKYLVEAIQNYQELYNKSVAAGDAVKDLQIAVKDQYKQLLENIIAEYEGQITNIEKQADIINERIARTEEHGYFVDQSYYDKLVEYEKDQNKKYAEELDEAVKRFNDAVVNGKIQEGTEAWNDMYQQVQDVNKAYEESNTELVKLNNTIMQLQWDKFDWLEERLSDIANEADWLIGLLQSENNYNDKGFLNNRGFAQAGLISAQYTDATERLKRYQKQYTIVSNQLANDPNNKNIIEEQEKIAQAMRDTANAEKEAMEAMQSLVREGISKYIESLGELIDKFKESLNTEKDLYDFQKNIANQTKSISDLEKQLAAYQGDDSEETRKKRQELQKQLNDAQQQLEETEWDRYISETNQMLDDMKSGVEEYLNDQTESIIAVMNNMQPYIQKNGEAITKGLQEVKNDYDIKSTEHFESLGDKIGNVGSIIDDFRKSMEKVTDPATNGVKGIVEHMSVDVKTIADGMITLTNSENNKPKSSDGSDTPSNGTDKKTGGASIKDDVQELFHKGSWQKDDRGNWYQYGNGSYAANEYVDGYWLNSEGYWDSSWDGSWKHNDKGYWWEYSDGSYPKNEWLKIDGDWYYFDSEGYMVTGKQTIGGKSYTFGSNGDWLGYAKGTKASPRDQLAWTQENASELIYRTSDGAMLTPLNRGDMVFTHDMSQRLWEIAKGNIPTTVGLAVPNVGSSNVRNVTSNNNITIELPNVENYNDFKREMKQDKELEKFWQEITIGQAMGNNTLKKNRY